MIDEGACQPCAFNASDNQKPRTVSDVQVLRLSGVTSESMLLHLSGSAKEVVCLGSTHPETVRFSLRFALAALARSRSIVVMVV